MDITEKKEITNDKKKIFYTRYELKNPAKILITMFLSFGVYFVNWIYFTNKSLELVDDEAPDSNRAFLILLIFPIFWLLFTIVLDKIIFKDSFIVDLITSLGWSLVIFLSLNYIYQFCVSFGKVTNSSGFVWYMSIYSGYFGLILFFMGFIYLIPLIFFPIITIPAMQAMINTRSEKQKFRNSAAQFNFKSRVNTY